MESWSVTKWIAFIIIVIVIFATLFFVLDSAGLFGRTVVERKVFENSYQYQAGAKEQIAIMEAQLAEINAQLANPNLDDETKADLRAQRSALKIRLNAAKEKLK